MRLAGHGLAVVLPSGWSGRITSRAAGGATLHAGSFPLALEDGEFGDESTGRMPAGAAFVALTEYRVDGRLRPGSGLYAPRRLPVPLDPAAFSPRRLSHARPGRLGAQHFATLAGRPVCLYVVLSVAADARARPGFAAAGRHPLRHVVDRLLATVEVSPGGRS